MSIYKEEDLLKMDAVEVYKLLLDNKISAFPQNFWNLENAKDNAARCTRYLIDDVLKMDHEQLKKESLTDLFKENKLYGMLNKYFNGSTFQVLENAYPSRFKEWELKSTPNGYWDNKYNGVRATRWLFEEKLKLTDEEIKKQLSIKLFEDNGLGGMLRKCFNSSVYEALQCVYPYRFKVWELRTVPNGYWDDPENIKSAIKWLIEERLKLSDKDLKTKLTVNSFKENGLGWLINKYFNSCLYSAVNFAYPNKYKEWEFFKAPKGLWDNKENGIRAVRWLIEDKLKLTDEQVRTALSYKVFEENGLGGMLKKCFNDSPFEAINATYPNKYQEWELSLTPKGIWRDKENGIRAVRWLIEDKLNLTDEEIKEQISAKFFSENGLRGMLRVCFNDSPFEAINSAYPNRFKRWELGPVPRGYWDNEDNIIDAVKWLFEDKLKIKEEQIKDSLNVKIFKDNSLGNLLRKYFNDKPIEIVKFVYPQLFAKEEVSN